MNYKYKVGDLFEITTAEDQGNFSDEVIMVVEQSGICRFSNESYKYKVYNLTLQMFMERTEPFLDKFYKKVN
jgi:hypothetical protein